MPASGTTTSPSHTAKLSAPAGITLPRWRGLSHTFRSLQHRNYRLFFFGQLVSLLGSWVQTTALTWLAYDLTQRSAWAAAVAAAQILPTFVLGAWGGALADRWPKRRLIFWTQSAFTILAFLLAGLTLSGQATPWALLIVSIANGVVQAIDLPARLAFVMDMVGREDLTNAVGLNSVLFNVARTAGPAAAGYTLAALGPGHCFLVNGLSFLPLLVALTAMDVAGKPARVVRRRPSVLAGFGYLLGQPQLAFLVLLAGLVSLCAWPFLALLPAFGKHVLGVQEQGFSQLLSGTGCGALTAALIVASFGSPRWQRHFVGIALALISLGLVGLSLAHSLAPAVAACAVIGFGLILFFATTQSAIQLGAGDHNRGRIMGIWAMILSGAVPLGNLLSGPAADVWGEPIVLRVQGLGCAACAIAVFAFFRARQRIAAKATA